MSAQTSILNSLSTDREPAMDSSKTHTPGPWSVREETDDQGNLCASVHGPDGNAITGWGCVRQSRANARLIAAAPDFLEALKECRELLDGLTRCKPGEPPSGLTIITFYARCVEAETKARAAIAKAEGR